MSIVLLPLGLGKPKTYPVYLGGAIFFEHRKMQLRAISFVRIKSILGIFFVIAHHRAIASDFGDYRRNGTQGD
ncbi:MAG: hypothetical protein WAP23_03885, partial [Candidatus Spechtbacterales bacterium]